MCCVFFEAQRRVSSNGSAFVKDHTTRKKTNQMSEGKQHQRHNSESFSLCKILSLFVFYCPEEGGWGNVSPRTLMTKKKGNCLGRPTLVSLETFFGVAEITAPHRV